ncbi:MAG: sterol desaturase family protein [Acidimicrobiales bacterium]
MGELADRVLSTLRDTALAPLQPTSDFFWPHLLGALAIAVLVQAAVRRRPLGPFLRAAFSPAVWWHRSARADYQFYLVNGVLYVLLVGPWLVTTAAVAGGVRRLLEAGLGEGPGLAASGAGVVGAYTVVHFVARDFGRWFGHWIQHRLALLWEFHKVHHSAEVLVPLTGGRVHPVDLVVMAVCANGVTGVVAGAALHLFPAGLDLWSVYGVNALVFAFDLLGSNLRHSPVWLSYGRRAERWLISPAQHQIHHSVEPRHWQKNLGFYLAVWDRLFGTLYVPERREALRFGTGEGRDADYHSVLRLYWLPLRAVWSRLTVPERVADQPGRQS